MLTVIREMAEEAERKDVPRAPGRRGPRPGASRGARTRVARTPEMLDVLRDAGVVDAGGAGLVEIVRGVVHALTGEPLPEAPS